MTDKITNTQCILIARPEGSEAPAAHHFRYDTQTIDPAQLADGEIIIKVDYISIDPTYKIWMSGDSYVPASPLDEPMRAFGLGKVIHSKRDGWEVGTWVTGVLGVQEYIVTDTTDPSRGYQKVSEDVLDRIGGPESFLPVLGITGFPTAYSGLETVAGDMEKEGKTLVVSGAAGNVGQWVVQLGKQLYGMKVVGIAGSTEKCDYLVNELGCDGAINYKSDDLAGAIREQCPDGVDLYFDNVGGNISDQVHFQMSTRLHLL